LTAVEGTKFADLQAILTKARQFLSSQPSESAMEALLPQLILARQRYGGVRDQLLGQQRDKLPKLGRGKSGRL